MQVSRVSDFFGSLINDFSWLRFSCGRLLDQLGNQLVGDFGFSVNTNKNMSCMKLRKRCNEMQHTQLKESIGMTDKQHSQNYGPRNGVVLRWGFGC